MDPELYSIGEIVFSPYRVAIIVAIVVGIILSLLESKKWDVSKVFALQSFALAVVGGLIGARVLYVIIHIDKLGNVATEILFMPQFVGLSFHGSILGSVALVWLWCRFRKVSFFKFSDLMIPYFFLGYAITRVGGCFVAGCCYGTSFELFWAVPMERLGDEVARHPVQIYAALLAMVIVIATLYIRRKQSVYGIATIGAFGMYGMLRFITEFFRTDNSEGVLWFLSEAQIASVFLIIGSVVFIRWLLQRKNHQEIYTSPKKKIKKTKF